MTHILNSCTITAEQTKTFFDVLTEIIWILTYGVPIAIIIFLIIKLILWIIETKTNSKVDYQIYNTTTKHKLNSNNQKTNTQSKYYLKTKTITDNEQYFLDIIKKHFSKQYEIRPQVPLSNVIGKLKQYSNEYQNELNRIIDVGIFDKETTTPLLLIEINDSSHEQKHRRARDKKVKEICKDAQIPLITFWIKYSNTEQYIVKRISKELFER